MLEGVIRSIEASPNNNIIFNLQSQIIYLDPELIRLNSIFHKEDEDFVHCPR